MSVDTFLLENGFALSILQQIDLHQDRDVMSCIWRSKLCWPLLWVWAIVNSCSFPCFCSVILYFGLFLFYKTCWSFSRVCFLISPKLWIISCCPWSEVRSAPLCVSERRFVEPHGVCSLQHNPCQTYNLNNHRRETVPFRQSWSSEYFRLDNLLFSLPGLS